MKRVPAVVFIILLAVAAMQPAPVTGASVFGGGEGGDGEIPLVPTVIATGPDNSVDGYYQVSPDEYGSFGAFGIINGVTEDLFNPNGAPTLQQTTFTSGFFLFVPATGEQTLLTNMSEWIGILIPGGNMTNTITGSNVASDNSGDGVDDTLTSSFTSVGASTSLSVDVFQQVSSLGGSVSQLEQQYTITNDGASTVTFELVRIYDGDLLWDSDFSNDSVGTTMHGAGLGTYVYEEEINIPGDTAVTLSSPTGEKYYGCKNGILPGLGDPACGFGTDVQVWDAGGLPASWENFIAGVGYDINGDSGEFPPGVGDPADGSIGMNWNITLGAGESTTVTVFHTFGQASPVACGIDLQLARRTVRPGGVLGIDITLEHRRPETVTAPFVVWIEDRRGREVFRLVTPSYTIRYGDRLELSPTVELPADMAPGLYRVTAGIERMQQGVAWTSQLLRVR